MQLLTAELRASLPRLYSQEKAADPQVICKFFTPDSNWTWFVTEGEPDEDNPEDIRFFGYVIGFEEEWGYFMLSELESARGPLRLPIERDLYFKPGPFSEVIQRYRQQRVAHQGRESLPALFLVMSGSFMLSRNRVRIALSTLGAACYTAIRLPVLTSIRSML